MRRQVSWLLIIFAATLLVGCTGSATVDGVGSPEAKPFLAIQPAGPGRDQAGFEGRLVVRDGCILVKSGRNYVLPVWPKGFTLAQNDRGRFMVEDADGSAVAVEGVGFNMTGSFKRHPHLKGNPSHQLHQLIEWLGHPVPEACIGGDVEGAWVVGKTSPLVAKNQ